MKTRSKGAMIVAAMLSFVAAGCSHLPGKPGFRPETMRPDQIHDFAVLYKSNCSACHGNSGLNGAALPLNNPVYLAWAGHDRLSVIVSNGVPHRLMPAFGPGGGGLLTDQQVEDIVNGMISHWGKPGVLNGANAPGYTSASKGDAEQGRAAFQTYCARCHRADGEGVSPGNSAATRSAVASKTNSAVGSIVDPTYLSLISSQGLRDVIVSGLPGEDMPDWRGDVSGKPMTDKEVTDVVAWLVSHRVQFPGQPFPTTQH
jgi:mono/diheme cytochrome c family protein